MNRNLKIKDVAKVTNGKGDVKDAVENGKYHFFDRSTLIKRSDNFLFDSEAIIIPGEDSRQIFEPRFFNGKFNLHQRCYVIYNFSDEFLPKFLYYKLKTLTKYFANVFVGSTVPSLRLEHITDLNIEFPNKEHQQKIASVLSALDNKIELNCKINEQLESMAKTIYDYWFVQFDFPDKNGNPYKASGGKMIFNETIKRYIPESWEVKGLDFIGTIIGGSTPSSQNPNFFEPNGIAWITPKDLSMNLSSKYISEGERSLTEEGKKSASLTVMPKGTVLMSSRAPIGYLAVAQNDLTTNQGFKSFIPKSYFTTEYIYYTVQHILPVIISNASGSTFQEISGTVLKEIHISVAPKNVVEAFNNMVGALLKRQEVAELENKQLTQLRDWLLPMLMNGQVKVGNEKEITH